MDMNRITGVVMCTRVIMDTDLDLGIGLNMDTQQ